MKKQLLLGSALFAAISAFSQHGGAPTLRVIQNQLDAELSDKYVQQPIGPVNQSHQTVNNTSNSAEKGAATSINWSLLCGSANCYGQLVSKSRPLQYNPVLNAVTFIHRRSEHYIPYPPANSNVGNILAEVSTNWGQTWDSTLIFSDPVNGGRFPQGAIYNPPGNSNIANSYIVGCGPVVANNAFTGNWYASKLLGAPGSTAAYNNTASPVTDAQQFLPFNLSTYPANQAPHGWSRNGFTAFDGGVVRSLGLIQDDNAGLTYAQNRGVALVKGTFNAGVFGWTVDSITPVWAVDLAGRRCTSFDNQMAWNNNGTVGYVVMGGVQQNASLLNRGFQPNIWKTTNSGQSWAPVQPINFNSPAMSLVVDRIHGTPADPSVKIPYLSDFDIVVDANDNLHIAATFMSAQSNTDDSLFFSNNFTTTINPNEVYSWTFKPGDRPYIYDFVGNGTSPWVVGLVDSMSSEGPSSQPGGFGYAGNPWDVANGGKQTIDSRLQMGRTPDGKFLTITWAESDSNFVSGFLKWNYAPDIKARGIAITSTLATSAYTNMCLVSNNEINVSSPLPSYGSTHPKVGSRATFHYMSPTSSTAAVTAVTNNTYSAEYTEPISCTNSDPYSQLTNNATWYTAAKLNFVFRLLGVGINETQANSVNASLIYPNPANVSANVRVELQNNAKVEISVMNLVGQVVKTTNVDAQIGENNINVDLNGLTSGVYMVNVKVGNNSSTKKLVVN